MVLLDARSYTIKYIATRKKNEIAEKQETQQIIDDTKRLHELDTGQDQATTNELLDKINTLKDIIQARNDYEETKS